MVLLSLAILATVTKVVRYFRRKPVESEAWSDLEQSRDTSISSSTEADNIRRRTLSLTAGGERPGGPSPLGMLLPRGGFNWRRARERVPPLRHLWIYLRRPRSLVVLASLVLLTLWWTVLSDTAEEVQRYVEQVEMNRGLGWLIEVR